MSVIIRLSFALRMKPNHVRAAVALATLAFAVAAVAYARAHWDGLYDDAFIYLRYVRNLDNGCGARFNCHGAAVEGFTSPLFLAVLLVGSLVTSQLIDLVQALDVVFLVAAGGLAIATAASLARDDEEYGLASVVCAAATCIALALDDFVLLNANTGLETSLAAASIALVGFAAVTARWRLLVAAVVILLLARPEGVVLLPLLAFLPPMRNRRYVIALAIAIVGIELIRISLFGSWLPNTYYAKSGGTWRHVELGGAYVLECVRDFPLTFLAPLALLIPSQRRTVAVVLALAAVWLVYFLRIGGDTFFYSRLWFPLVPVLTAFSIAGAAKVIRHRRGHVAALVLATVVAVRARFEHTIPDQHASSRIQDWIAAGTYLREHYPRGTLVATVPIGAIGYYSSLPILDLVGLTDETIARSGNGVPSDRLTRSWIGHERSDTAYVLRREPGVIVTTMIRDRPWTLREARAGFWADWQLLVAIQTGHAPYKLVNAELAPSRFMLMFERR